MEREAASTGLSRNNCSAIEADRERSGAADGRAAGVRLGILVEKKSGWERRGF